MLVVYPLSSTVMAHIDYALRVSNKIFLYVDLKKIIIPTIVFFTEINKMAIHLRGFSVCRRVVLFCVVFTLFPFSLIREYSFCLCCFVFKGMASKLF